MAVSTRSMLAGAGLALATTVAPTAHAEPTPAHGFRLHTAHAQHLASLRLVVVPGPATVYQQVPRLRLGSDRFSGDLQLPVVQAVSPELDWTHVAPGRLLLGGRAHLGDHRHHAIVVETGARLGQAQAWGSHSSETLAGFGVRAGWEGTWTPGRSTLLARSVAGLEDPGAIAIPFYFDCAFAWVFPVVEAASLTGVLEVEVMLVDAVPSSGRLLLRWTPGDGPLVVDVGGQLSAGYTDDTGAGAAVAQVGYRL